MKQHVDAIACRVMQVVPGHTTLLVGWSRAEHLSASGKGLQGAEPQGCAENKAISQRDQKYCRSSYRMSYGRGCSAANKLVGSERISPIQGTADPQVPSVINISFLQLHEPFGAPAPGGGPVSGAHLAQMHPQQPSRGATWALAVSTGSCGRHGHLQFLNYFPNPPMGAYHTHGGTWQLWQIATYRFGVDCSF